MKIYYIFIDGIFGVDFVIVLFDFIFELFLIEYDDWMLEFVLLLIELFVDSI